MADPRTETTASTVTVRRRRRDVTTWRKESGAWPPGRIAALGVAGLVLLGGAGTAWSVNRIEDDLTDSVTRDLTAAGIDTAGLEIDASYRTVSISGAAPSGVTEDAVRAAVGVDGLRELEVDLDGATAASPSESTTTDEVSATTDPTTTAPTDPTTTSAAPRDETGTTDVGVAYDTSSVTLTGTVPTESQRERLVAAAAALVGAGNVVDELEVSDRPEATPGADDRIDDLSDVIAGLAGLSSAQATLTDTSLTLSADAPDQGAADAASALISAVTSVGGSADIAVLATEPTTTGAPADGDVAAEVTDLQAELDGLAEAIRTTVVFPTGSAELSAEARSTLDQVAAAMARYPAPVVEIAGHTDSRGAEQANQELSQRRAQAVVDYVASQGIDLGRLRARGAGEAEPIAPNETPEGQAANRRVEFSARPSF